MRRAQSADTHALKRHRLSKNTSPDFCIASGMHLEPESEKLAKKPVDFHTAKKYPNTNNTFSLFLDEFLQIDLQLIYCSLTTKR